MDNNMKKNSVPKRESLILLVGEIIVSLLVILIYLLVDLVSEYSFSYTVVTGVLLGSAVTVLNFLFLSLSVNKAIDSFLEERGEREMSEEEAEQFANEHSMKIQNSVKTSFIIRTVSMLAALVLAFILDWFDPLATAVPLLMFRPIISAGEAIRKKYDKAPNPEAFIEYKEQEEKEEDD